MMEGITLMEPTVLYNILNQGKRYPNLSDLNYLLLLDARNKEDFGESHILTAKRAIQIDDEFKVPYNAELECKKYIIVYDSNADSLKSEGPALSCAKMLWNNGSRNPVHILNGGYEAFSALYPFLRTQKIIYMPRELDAFQLYPCEVIPSFMYIGNWVHAQSAQIHKDLKIKAQINCYSEKSSFFPEKDDNVMCLDYDDVQDEDLISYFPTICTFINEHKAKGNVMLVFSKQGISTAPTLVIAYIMKELNHSLKEAFLKVKACYEAVQPSKAFMNQLSAWEEKVHGERLSNVDEFY